MSSFYIFLAFFATVVSTAFYGNSFYSAHTAYSRLYSTSSPLPTFTSPSIRPTVGTTNDAIPEIVHLTSTPILPAHTYSLNTPAFSLHSPNGSTTDSPASIQITTPHFVNLHEKTRRYSLDEKRDASPTGNGRLSFNPGRMLSRSGSVESFDMIKDGQLHGLGMGRIGA